MITKTVTQFIRDDKDEDDDDGKKREKQKSVQNRSESSILNFRAYI